MHLVPRRRRFRTIDFFGAPLAATFNAFNKFPVDIQETDKAFVVEAELPGYKKDNITVKFTQGTLVIEAKHEQSIDKEHENKYLYRERSYGSFRRSFGFAEDINEDAIEANFQDGVLKIILPKSNTEEKKHRNIPIN
ncbi:MAG: Hsp20/alpha crystallin family protein [Firmicutes bacterium]|nr:Hsp20/alpha crystallin family protein [Bacillota bacterium]